VNAERFVVVAAVLAAGLAAAADGQSLATEGRATWQLSSPLVSARGLALWLNDGAGSWRLEIGVAEDTNQSVAELFARRGNGWTLACAGGSSVLLQPWGEPWREAGPDFGTAVAAVLGRWEGSTAEVCSASVLWRAGPARVVTEREAITVGELPDDWNPGAAAGAAGGNLRRELTARGRGRGGPGLRLRLGRTQDGDLELTSARWPGRLHLSPATSSRRADVPAEAYLPIWSLAEIGLSLREP
jgi:hypothetical protein